MANNDYISDLEQLFPWIANNIVSYWGKPEFEPYAYSVIIDQRGDRQGLPKEVLSEILFLYALHLYTVGYDPSASPRPFSEEP